MHLGYGEKNKNVFYAKHATAHSVNMFLQLVRFRFRFARPERQWFSYNYTNINMLPGWTPLLMYFNFYC
ncbi:hypothetical protein NC651_017022 [Populus alba x Populus x berolinensis]|nr:hypothetical protein NC651_017022 [Populus alba x Populus x berolinensis]